MWRILAIALCFVTIGCSARQAKNLETVAAFEVPLPSEQDRQEFLKVLRRVAEAEGLHVDADSTQVRQDRSHAIPEATMTIHAAVWRGTEDDELEASVMDLPGHLGRPWISFSKGEDPNLATKFRQRAMAEIMRRWPDTRILPILPSGGLPLHSDLVLTKEGYRVKREAAGTYDLPLSSPLVAQL